MAIGDPCAHGHHDYRGAECRRCGEVASAPCNRCNGRGHADLTGCCTRCDAHAARLAREGRLPECEHCGGTGLAEDAPTGGPTVAEAVEAAGGVEAYVAGLLAGIAGSEAA